MDNVTKVIVGIQVVDSIMLIVFILLHSGQGSGLSDMFGGGGMASGSSVVERNLDRVTIATAVVFAFTTVILDLRLQ